MPKASQMRFAVGQVAYWLQGNLITCVKIKSWASGLRGGAITYHCDTVDDVLEGVSDANLYHAKASAEAAYQERCASQIAFHQQQVNEWTKTMGNGCKLTDDSFVETAGESKPSS